MTNELEDWQLSILVEARRFNDPVIVEAEEAKALSETEALRSQIEDRSIDVPVVVELTERQQYERANDLLEQADGISDPEVVSKAAREEELEAVEAVQAVLGEALSEANGLPEATIERMDVLSMVEAFRDEDSDGISLEALSQMPETGSAPEPEAPEDDTDPEEDVDPLADISRDEREEAEALNAKADLFEDRTPEYAAALRQQAADVLGLDDPDDIVEVL